MSSTSNVTTASRRTFLRGVAIAAATMTPAAAAAFSGLAPGAGSLSSPDAELLAVTFAVDETRLAAPTLKDDPLFAAIRRHAEAWKAYHKFFEGPDDVDEDSPNWKQVCKAEKRETALAWKLVTTKPTTISATIILVRYVVELQEKHHWDAAAPGGWHGEFHKAILDALWRLPGRTGLDNEDEVQGILQLIAREAQS